MIDLPEARLYIDGSLRRAAGDRTFEIIGPWTGEAVGRAADASTEDVHAAITAARRAFDTTEWSTDRELRFNLLNGMFDHLVADRERLLMLARVEAGASIGAATRAQVDMAITCYRELLELFPEIEWERHLGRKGPPAYQSDRKVIYEAVGAVAAITPWNVPLYINVGKVVSALLAGCTVILNPAPNTPNLGAIFGEWANTLNFPPGVLNVITSADPASAGEMLVTDPRVDSISFTGSTSVGRRIMALGAPTLKRVFLELGGKSARIVLDDAPDFAREIAQSMLVFHAGQGCAVTSRLLVPRSRYAEAIGILKNVYGGLGDDWGEFDNPAHMMGPVISAKQLQRVKYYVDLGVAEGATLIAGGNLRPDKGGGWFIEPTCFVDVTNDMRIAREEIFGPVLVVIPFDDDDHAVRIANDSDYGLSGAIVSADLGRAERIAKAIRTGSVSVNGGMCIAGDLPFGGRKASGIGREWGVEGIEEFLESKVIAFGCAAA